SGTDPLFLGQGDEDGDAAWHGGIEVKAGRCLPLCIETDPEDRAVRERFPHRRARNPLSSGGPSTGRPAASAGRPPPGPGGVFPEPESPLCSGEELKPTVRTGERGRKGFPDILHGMSTKHHRRPVEGPVRKGQGFGKPASISPGPIFAPPPDHLPGHVGARHLQSGSAKGVFLSRIPYPGPVVHPATGDGPADDAPSRDPPAGRAIIPAGPA